MDRKPEASRTWSTGWLAAEPGTAYQCSIGLNVTGLVIERVSGTSLLPDKA